MIYKLFVGLFMASAMVLGQSSYYAPGPGPNGPQLGYRLLRMSDINGDGIPEYVISRHGDTTVALLQGAVELRDGATDALIWKRYGIFQQEQYGRNLGLADWNGDGILDIVAVAQASLGAAPRIEILDATTGGLITTLNMPAGTATGDVGVSIASRDLNFDGLDEIVLGTVPTAFQTYAAVRAAGQAVVFSPTAAPLVISNNESDFGRCVMIIDDIDFDALPDIVVTAPYADSTVSFPMLPQAGYIQAISTATQATIWSLRGALPYARLGELVVNTPDLDFDFIGDIAIVSHSSAANATLADQILVVSGATSSTFGPFDAPFGTIPTNDMQVVSDLDGDGVPELAVLSTLAQSSTACVDIISLKNGHHLDRLLAPSTLGGTLTALALLPDTNGDGNTELLTSSSYGVSTFGGLVRDELKPVLSAIAGGSSSQDLLEVNGSTHLPSRRADLAIGQPFTIGVVPDPTTGQPTDFIIWGLIGIPNSASAYSVGVGATFLFPPRVAAPGLPWLFCLADSVGFDPAAAFPGFTAPWTLGAPFGIPFAIDLTFQGVTISGGNIDISNGILLHVR